MLPNPSPESVALWLSQLDRTFLHDQAWKEVNKRLHGMARVSRPFIQENFSTDAQQEAAFDGFVLGLITMLRFSDIEELSRLDEKVPSKQPD